MRTLVTAAALAATTPALAATWTVDDDGPADFTSIAAAIAAAADGDTISVKNGTYTEVDTDPDGPNYSGALVIKKSLTIVGESTDGVVVTAGPAPGAHHAAITLGVGTWNSVVANMTIIVPTYGTFSGTPGYAVFHHAYPPYNASSGTITVRNVVVKLPTNRTKGLLYGNSTNLQIIAENCIFDFSGGGGTTDYINYANPSNTLRNTIVIGNTAAGNSFVWEYSIRQGAVPPGTGNSGADPLFTDAANGDYTLLPGSPAIDAGIPLTAYDDLDGTRNDIGVYGGPGATVPGCPPTITPTARAGVDVCVDPGATVHATAVLGQYATVHAGAIVAPKAVLGSGAVVGAGSVVGRRANLGARASLGANVTVARGASVGAGTALGDGSVVGYGAAIGDSTDLGPATRVANLATIGGNVQAGSTAGGVRIGRAATIADGAVLGDGVVLGPATDVGVNATIGTDSRLRRGAWMGSSAALGNSSSLGRNAGINSGITVGNGTDVRSNACVGVSIGDGLTVPHGADNCGLGL